MGGRLAGGAGPVLGAVYGAAGPPGPPYIAGLIGPGDRKSIRPMAARLGLRSYDALHHFVSTGRWDAEPLGAELLAQADRLVGGPDAVLIVDDTALPEKGTASLGVAPQYASRLGRNANCQTLVSLTPASGEVPVPIALRLFLPESWTADAVRLDKAGVPPERRTFRTKPEIALEEIDRVLAARVRFGCVLAEAGYGRSAPFLRALTERGLRWAVGSPAKPGAPADEGRARARPLRGPLLDGAAPARAPDHDRLAFLQHRRLEQAKRGKKRPLATPQPALGSKDHRRSPHAAAPADPMPALPRMNQSTTRNRKAKVVLEVNPGRFL